MFTTVIERARILTCETRLVLWNHVSQLPAYPTDISTTLGLAPSTVSYHLAVLERAGLVRHVQLGRCRLYEGTGIRWSVASEDEIDAGL